MTGPITKKELGGIRDGRETILSHAKDADLVHAAESVLRRTQHAVIERALALEVQNRIDDVLERPRTRDAAALRDVAHDEDGGAALLREAHQARGALAHLPDVAGRALEITGVNSLDGVDDEHRRRRRGRRRNDRLEVCLAEETHVTGIVGETIRPEFDLERALLARSVKRRAPRQLESRRHLKQQRGLADAGLTAEQDHGTRDDSAAEDEVEFREIGGPSRGLGPAHRAKPRRGNDAPALTQCTCTARPPARSRGRSRARDGLLDERVPCAARVATAGPFGMVGAALGAAVRGLCFGAHAAE